MRTLEEIKNKIYNQFHSKLNPLENTPKYDLVKIISDVEAGIYFSLLGDIEFLKKQIFPDTAEKEYLRAHWADIVPPLYPENGKRNFDSKRSRWRIASRWLYIFFSARKNLLKL